MRLLVTICQDGKEASVVPTGQHLEEESQKARTNKGDKLVGDFPASDSFALTRQGVLEFFVTSGDFTRFWGLC